MSHFRGDFLSGKPVRQLNNCQGNVTELSERISGRQGNVRENLFIANFTFGATPLLNELLRAAL